MRQHIFYSVINWSDCDFVILCDLWLELRMLWTNLPKILKVQDVGDRGDSSD